MSKITQMASPKLLESRWNIRDENHKEKPISSQKYKDIRAKWGPNSDESIDWR